MALTFVSLAVLPRTAAAQGAALEYAVKANFLYKFGPFVDWPPQTFDSPSASFNVCVLGSDPFGGVLDDAVRGQKVYGRPVAVRRMQTVSTSPSCHVLYIGRSSQQSTSEVLQVLERSPVLTVTEERLGGGGLVDFVIREGRVRFSINAERARAAGLAISSKLLALALPVQRAAQS